MPTVPRRTGLGVASSPLGTERASPNAPAGAFGAAPVVDPTPVLAPLAQAAQALYERERRRADTVAMLDADNRMSALRRGLLTDPEQGIYQQRGRAALEASGKVYEQWQKGVSDIEASLATDEQKLRFRQYAQQQTAQMRESVDRHVAQEVEREDKDVTDAALSSAVDDAIGNYDNSTLVEAAVAKYSAVLGDFAAHHRVPPEVLERTRAEGRSKIHVAVIGRLLDNGQDRRAAAHYDAYGDEIVAGHRGAVEKALQEGSTEGEAQRQADRIMAAPDANRTAAYEAAKQITDPKVRSATERRIDTEFDRRDEASRVRYAGTLEAAWRPALEGRRPSAALMAQLKASDIREIDAYLKRDAKGERPETDPVEYYALSRMAAERPDDFRKVNLLSRRTHLSPSDFEKFADLQRQIAKGDGRAADRTTRGLRAQLRITNDAIGRLGIKTTAAPGTKTARKVALFHQLVDEEILGWKQATGKDDIPDAEVQRIVDDLTIKDEAGLVGFNELIGRDPEDVKDIRDVPLGEQQGIRAELARQRRTISTGAIVEAYREKLRALRGAW